MGQYECPYCGKYFHHFAMVSITVTHWTLDNGWIEDEFLICQGCDDGVDN